MLWTTGTKTCRQNLSLFWSIYFFVYPVPSIQGSGCNCGQQGCQHCFCEKFGKKAQNYHRIPVICSLELCVPAFVFFLYFEHWTYIFSTMLHSKCLGLDSNWLRGGRVVRWCRVNFQCWGVLLIWIIVWQGPIALAAGAGGGCLDIFFSRLSFLFFFPLSGRWCDRYFLKGPLSPKTTNQPNQTNS